MLWEVFRLLLLRVDVLYQLSASHFWSLMDNVCIIAHNPSNEIFAFISYST